MKNRKDYERVRKWRIYFLKFTKKLKNKFQKNNFSNFLPIAIAQTRNHMTFILIIRQRIIIKRHIVADEKE